jgi:hypothetical protein
VYRSHYRHRGVEPFTGGDSELGSMEIQGIGTGNFAGAGAGPGFRGPGPFISSFRSSFRSAMSRPSWTAGRRSCGCPCARVLSIQGDHNLSSTYAECLISQADWSILGGVRQGGKRNTCEPTSPVISSGHKKGHSNALRC